jgi:hypothetical protein
MSALDITTRGGWSTYQAHQGKWQYAWLFSVNENKMTCIAHPSHTTQLGFVEIRNTYYPLQHCPACKAEFDKLMGELKTHQLWEEWKLWTSRLSGLSQHNSAFTALRRYRSNATVQGWGRPYPYTRKRIVSNLARIIKAGFPAEKYGEVPPAYKTDYMWVLKAHEEYQNQ